MSPLLERVFAFQRTSTVCGLTYIYMYMYIPTQHSGVRMRDKTCYCSTHAGACTIVVGVVAAKGCVVVEVVGDGSSSSSNGAREAGRTAIECSM